MIFNFFLHPCVLDISSLSIHWKGKKVFRQILSTVEEVCSNYLAVGPHSRSVLERSVAGQHLYQKVSRQILYWNLLLWKRSVLAIWTWDHTAGQYWSGQWSVVGQCLCWCKLVTGQLVREIYCLSQILGLVLLADASQEILFTDVLIQGGFID